MHYRRRDYSRSSLLCMEMLESQFDDQPALFYKCRSLSALNWSDGSELEMEGLADLMLDENAVSTMPRFLITLGRVPVFNAGRVHRLFVQMLTKHPVALATTCGLALTQGVFYQVPS